MPFILKIHHVMCTGKTSTSPKLLYQGLHEKHLNVSLSVICEQKPNREKSVYQLFDKTHTYPTCLVQNNIMSKGTNKKHYSIKIIIVAHNSNLENPFLDLSCLAHCPLG